MKSRREPSWDDQRDRVVSVLDCGKPQCYRYRKWQRNVNVNRDAISEYV